MFFLANDICNSSVTNRVCILTPTNLDSGTSTNATGYECNCKTGFQEVSQPVCQGFYLLEKKKGFLLNIFCFRRY